MLSASRYPGVDIPFVADQIEARKRAREKLPAWYNERGIVYPSRLAVEQCSSEQTAGYKRALAVGETLCDLTGGLGVDAWSFSRAMKEVLYVERLPAYCEAARHNFTVLGAGNIRVICGEAGDRLPEISADTIYLDPARRAAGNRRVFALADSEPDLLQLKPLLLKAARRVIVKISPMADLSETVRLLPETGEIHLLSVRNECKELLFVLGHSPRPEAITIHAVNFTSSGKEQHNSFLMQEERESIPFWAERVEEYLYEPHASLLKAGAFKWVSSSFQLKKLHPHSHLYTADRYLPDFPGRVFVVEEQGDFSGRQLKQIARRYPKANITTRNFNLTAAELRRKSGITEGGECYLFATTLSPGIAKLLLCRKAIRV